MKIRITDFAKRRHFKGKSGTQIRSLETSAVEDMINMYYNAVQSATHPTVLDEEFTKGIEYLNYRLLDGYADFCKLLIVPNFTDARTGTAELTNENYQWLRDGFNARSEFELPVPTRALHLPMPAEKAKYLVFVLYTNEHLIKEHAAVKEQEFKLANEKRVKEGKEPLTEEAYKSLMTIDGLKYEFDGDTEVEWGVVSIMGQMVNVEEPMQPITMIRNHMGMEFGGSGEPLNRDAYLRSVAFWENHAIIA